MKRLRDDSAFTLLELLVAATITLVLAGLMLSVTTGTLNLWRRTQGDLTSATQATLALDLIERDLQAGLFRKDGINTWLAVGVTNSGSSLGSHGWLSAPLMKPATDDSLRLLPAGADGRAPVIRDARFGLSGAWLRFIAATAESGSEAALPRAIAYQIARRPVSGPVSAANPADTRYSLFRSAAGNAATFDNGYDVTAATHGSSLTNPGSADVLATNVVDFCVWLHVRDNATGALRRIFPADNADLSHAARDNGSAADPNRYPDAADIMLRVLTDEGARLVDGMERAGGLLVRPAAYQTDAEWWWAVVEANSRVYMRRVEIMGGMR